MIILKNQLLEPIDSKKYQTKIRNELKNPDMLRFKIITIP